jgi:hypothetical protein
MKGDEKHTRLDLRTGNVKLGGTSNVQADLLDADEVLAGWDAAWDRCRELALAIGGKPEGIESRSPLGDLA